MSDTPTPTTTTPPTTPVIPHSTFDEIQGFGQIKPAIFTYNTPIEHLITEDKLTREEAIQHVMDVLGITNDDFNYDMLDDTGMLEMPSKQVRWFKQTFLSDTVGPDEKHGPTGLRQILQSIVYGLPEDSLYPSVIAQLDPSQLMMRAMDQNPQLKTPQNLDILAQKNTEQQDAIKAIVATNPTTAKNPAAGQTAVTDWQKRRDSTELDVSPTAAQGQMEQAVTTGAATAEEVAYDPNDPTAIFSQSKSKARPILTQTDIQRLFREDYSPTGGFNAVSQLATRSDGSPGYDVQGMVQYSGSPTGPRVGAQGQSLKTGTGRAFTISQAQTAYFNFTQDEMKQLQQRLKVAGYFDNTDGGQTLPQFEGDPNDPRFAQAWLRLVGDSVRAGSSMVDVLDQKAKTRLSSGNYDAMGNPVDPVSKIQLTDSARIRENSDAAAIKLIGRPLGDDEQNLLVNFIHSLERRKQKEFDKYKNSPNAAEYLEYDTDAQIDQWIKTIMPLDANNNGQIDKKERWTIDSLVNHILGPGEFTPQPKLTEIPSVYDSPQSPEHSLLQDPRGIDHPTVDHPLDPGHYDRVSDIGTHVERAQDAGPYERVADPTHVERAKPRGT